MAKGDPIALAVNKLRLDSSIVGVDFDFEPSVGIVAKRIDKLASSIEHFREPILKSIIEVMIPSFRANFTHEGRPDTWEPLAEYTVKLRNGQTGPILRRSGALMHAATSVSIWSISDTAAVIKSLPTEVWYGYLHQAGYGGFGAHVAEAKKRLGAGARPAQITQLAYKLMDEKSKSGKEVQVSIPARPFILFQDEDLDDVQGVFYRWMSDKIDEDF